MSKSFKLGKYNIGEGHPPFIIAEMSGNHNQSLERALKIVEAAASAGAHAIKLQTYTADTMTIDCDSEDFTVTNPDNLWAGRTLYDLYQEAHTPWDWHHRIFELARELDMIPLSTPFDETAVDFLESLNPSIYKISSLENTDHALIKKVAQTGKPIILSTGLMSKEDIIETVEVAKSAGCEDLILLKCTSSYPAEASDANLATMLDMKEFTKCNVGLSDHTMGIGVPVASVIFGACVIEKHFTLSRSDGGVDSAFSLEPEELKAMVIETNKAFNSIGKITYKSGSSEDDSRKYRRSLYVTENVKAGDKVCPENVRAIRPGLGLMPKHLDKVMQKSFIKDIKRGTALEWSMLE